MNLQNLPTVSIIIPSRNEESNLPFCLKSLEKIDYPKEKLEIILGNDNSDDATPKLLQAFANQYSHVRYINIPKAEENETLKAKTRALNFLIKESTGDFLFFSDADIELPAGWIKAMLKNLEPNVGVMVGVTAFRNTDFLNAMQGTEWLMALTMMKVFSDYKIPTTGMGNNMMVSRKAYEAVGGYEKIGFSIVEDYALYQAIIAKGFDFKHVFEPEIVAYTRPPLNFLEQRKRWIKGALESKSWLIVLGLSQAFYLPVFILLAIYSPILLGITNCILFLFYFFIVLFFEKKLALKGYLRWLPVFLIYMPVTWFVQGFFFFFSKKLDWKVHRPMASVR